SLPRGLAMTFMPAMPIGGTAASSRTQAYSRWHLRTVPVTGPVRLSASAALTPRFYAATYNPAVADLPDASVPGLNDLGERPLTPLPPRHSAAASMPAPADPAPAFLPM